MNKLIKILFLILIISSTGLTHAELDRDGAFSFIKEKATWISTDGNGTSYKVHGEYCNIKLDVTHNLDLRPLDSFTYQYIFPLKEMDFELIDLDESTIQLTVNESRELISRHNSVDDTITYSSVGSFYTETNDDAKPVTKVLTYLVKKCAETP